jgi:hypothetical protein
MFLCGIADSAVEQPKVHRTLSSVARAVVSIPEAVLVNEFSSGENAGVVYYVMKCLLRDTPSATALTCTAGCLRNCRGLHVGRSPALSRLL